MPKLKKVGIRKTPLHHALGFALFLHALGTSGQEPKGSASQAERAQASVCELRGTVVRSTTGEPVTKAWVTLRPAGGQGLEHSTAANSKGQFILRGLDPGLYFLDAQAAGFPSQRYSESTSSDSTDPKVLLLKSDGVRDILFRLVPGGVITGTAYDEDGDPIIGAHVAALRRTHGRVSVFAEGETNDHGEYRLFWLAPGRYYVLATNLNGSKAGVSLPTYYPNASHLEQATPVESLPDRETSGINIRSAQGRGVAVSGQLAAPVKGNSLQGVFVQLIPRDTVIPGYFYEGRFGSVADQNGRFDFPSVPPAVYILYANLNQPDRGYSGSTEVNVDNADISGISLTLKPNVDLTVRVRTDPEAKMDFTKLRIRLEPRGNLMLPPLRIEPRADGRFILTQVHMGDYHVQVAGYPEGFYLKSARVGDVDVLVSGLTVDGIRTGDILELELSQKGGRINGTVVHEFTPAPAALVTLIPDPPQRERRDLYMQRTADFLGRFSFLGVPPGNFRLFAWENAEDSRIDDPEFLKTSETLGQRLHIEAKQSQSVQVELIPALDMH